MSATCCHDSDDGFCAFYNHAHRDGLCWWHLLTRWLGCRWPFLTILPVITAMFFWPVRYPDDPPWWALVAAGTFFLVAVFNVLCCCISVTDWSPHADRQTVGDRGDPGTSASTGSTPHPGSISSYAQYARAKQAIGPGESSGVNELPVRAGSEPVRAWKRAIVVWTPLTQQYRFRGVGRAVIYSTVDEARCEDSGYGYISYQSARFALSLPGSSPPPPHGPVPKASCGCGFYGYSEQSSLDAWNGPVGVALEVEFYGRVIVCENGYRAEKQRVKKLHLDHCFLCCEPVATVLIPGAYRSNSNEPEPIRFACPEHAASAPPEDGRVETGQLRAALGVEIVPEDHHHG